MAQTNIGVVFAMSDSTPASEDQAGYAALSYTDIGSILDGGEGGTTQDLILYTPLETGEEEKEKGVFKFNDRNITFINEGSDAGQVLLKAAADDAFSSRKSFSLTYPSGDIDYFQAVVAGFGKTTGSAGQMIEGNTVLGVTSRTVYA